MMPLAISHDNDPLRIYLKEIRKIPLLTTKEEQHWALILYKSNLEKAGLLKRAVEILHGIQTYKPLNQLLVITRDSLCDYLYLEEALALYKRIDRSRALITKAGSTREKRKLAKETVKLNEEFEESLAKINLHELKNWQVLAEENGAKRADRYRRFFLELNDIWSNLKQLEPRISEARQKLIQSNLRLVVSICRHYRNRARVLSRSYPGRAISALSKPLKNSTIKKASASTPMPRGGSVKASTGLSRKKAGSSASRCMSMKSFIK